MHLSFSASSYIGQYSGWLTCRVRPLDGSIAPTKPRSWTARRNSATASGTCCMGINATACNSGLREKLQPFFRTDGGIEGPRRARRAIGRRVKMIQAGNPVARAAIVKRRLDESENVVGILHHMTVGIDVVVRHSASFCGLHTLTPNGLATITSLNVSHLGGHKNWRRSCASPRRCRALLCKEASRIDASSCTCTPPSTCYKPREMEQPGKEAACW